MNQETIIIDNLKCGGCANTVMTQLTAMEGVDKVTVDVITSTVIVDKEEKATRVLLLDKLTKWGYPEVGTSNLVQKAKSYVSCAIGRLDK